MPRLLAAVLSLTLLCVAPLAAAQSTGTDAAASAPHSASVHSPASDSTDLDAPPEEAPDGEPWDRTKTYVHDHADEYVGFDDDWSRPYDRESAVYRAAPPIRYNRVEGPVIGFRRDPLSLRDPDNQARIYGQVGYAFALKDVRYTVGVESRLLRTEDIGLKFGVSYQEQTLTTDRWKTSYAENSLAGLGFEYDFFDYYEAQGVSVYVVQTLPHTLKLTTGFRSEEHRPLTANTDWSLFEAGRFRANPSAEQGRLQAGFVSLEGGHIRDRDDLPTGQAFRLAATIGEPFGGDLRVNRYVADGRLFLPINDDTRLGLRLRGGYAAHGAPLQTQFTLGGIGSLRSYDQNALRGTRMLLGNVEYVIDGATLDDDFLDDLFLVGLFDAGWVGQSGERFRMNDVLPSAGFGIGLDEREIRLDVSWPLRPNNPVAGSGPSIWLRITPNF